jgi:hypothetical protein
MLASERPPEPRTARSRVGDDPQADLAAPAAFDERVFLYDREPSPRERAALVSMLATRLGGVVLRAGRFEARAGDEYVAGRVDARAVAVSFSDQAARARWLGTIQQVARESGLSPSE